VKLLIVCFVSCAVVCGAFGAGCGGGTGNKTTGTGGMGGVGGTGGSTGTGGVNGNCSFTACGGNLVGTWTIQSICTPSPFASCPEPVMVDRSGAVATYTFGSNGVFTYAASGTVIETISYRKDCLSSSADAGLSDLCTALQSAVQSSIASADGGAGSGITGFTCAVQNDRCVCTETFMNLMQNETGTYTTSGNQVTIMITSGGSTDGGIPTSDYCVSGSTLKLRSTSTSGSEVVATLTR
jgi:hypothetical protein